MTNFFDSIDLAVPFDWFILALRIAFILLIYYFLYLVARVSIRELATIGAVAGNTDAPVLPNPTSALVVMDPAESSLQPGEQLPLDHYTTIGRREGNTMVVDDHFTSSDHAEVTFENGHWWVQDLSSTNGSTLNGAALNGRRQLSPHDVVQFGRVTFRVMI